jgi:hypothetical protein
MYFQTKIILKSNEIPQSQTLSIFVQKLF